jgi:hypothetical protein
MLHLFVRGTDDKIYRNVFSSSGWSGWIEVPGNARTSATPAAVEFGGLLYLFMTGTDQRLFHNVLFVSESGNSWSGWNEVYGGGLALGAGPGATAYNNQLYLFVRGYQGRIYQNVLMFNRWFGWTWSGWSEVPGNGWAAGAPAATASYYWGLRLFVRGFQNRIYENVLGSSWSGWNEVNGNGHAVAGPAATSDEMAYEVADIFITGVDYRIYQATGVFFN